MEVLLENERYEIIETIMKEMTHQNPIQVNIDFLTFLAANLSDRSFDLSKLLYKKMKEFNIELTPLIMNYLLFNSAHFA
jgi:hypothetical protein